MGNYTLDLFLPALSTRLNTDFNIIYNQTIIPIFITLLLLLLFNAMETDVHQATTTSVTSSLSFVSST